MALDANFVKLLMVKGPEGRDQGAKRVYQRKLCPNDLHDQVKVCLLCEGEAALGFALHLRQRDALREQVRDQYKVTVGDESQVAALVTRLETAAE